MKVCAIMQPTYLPWLGYFDLIDQSDVFIFYDDVQFEKQSWQTRNRIALNSQIIFVNLLFKKSSLNTKIQDVELVDNKLNFSKLLKTFHQNYKKQIYFDEVYPFLESFFSIPFTKLSDFNISFIKDVSFKLGIKSEMILSSNIKKNTDDRIGKLLELCLISDCDTYLSAKGSADYIYNENGLEKFLKANVNLVFQNYTPYPYKENDFIPYMSIIDCLFHNGFEKTLTIIRKGRNQNQKLLDFYEKQ